MEIERTQRGQEQEKKQEQVQEHNTNNDNRYDNQNNDSGHSRIGTIIWRCQNLMGRRSEG